MKHINKPTSLSNYPKKEGFRLPSDTLIDKGTVRLGGQGPAFRKISIEDKGKVRLGGQGPIFKG